MNVYNYKIDELEKSTTEEDRREIIEKINELLLQSHSEEMLHQLKKSMSNNGRLYRIFSGNETDISLSRKQSAAFGGIH